MASPKSRKAIVLEKYRTELLNTFGQCIADVLPDPDVLQHLTDYLTNVLPGLESAGAITIEQMDKVREYVDGRMPANAVDYLLDDHIKGSSVAGSAGDILKLLEAVKKVPNFLTRLGNHSEIIPLTHCKQLAEVVERDLKIDMSGEADEVTKWLKSLGNGTKELQELIESRLRRWKTWQANKTGGLDPDIHFISLYSINGYEPSSTSQGSNKEYKWKLVKPFFLAKRPNGKLFVRDNDTQRLVIYHYDSNNRLVNENSDWICGKGYGQGRFQDITGIATSDEYLYVADSQLCYVQKLHYNGDHDKNIGEPGSGNGQFDSPFGLALDEANSLLYVCDYGNHRIQVFKNDEYSYKFGKYGTKPGELNHPCDLTLNNTKDQLFITEVDNCRVQVFKTSGSPIGVFGDAKVTKLLRRPIGIFFVTTALLLISSGNEVYMVNFAKQNDMIVSAVDGSFNFPCGVLMMGNGLNGDIVVANFLGDSLTVV